MPKHKRVRLLTEERRREILGILGENGRVTVEEVANRFGVSTVTARGDLDALSEIGVLVRSHGGGIRPLAAAPEHPLKVRESMHHDEKVRIAMRAAELIKPFQTIALCTGSTSAALAAQVRRKCPDGLTVITYALNVASILAELPNISMVMLGGFLRHTSGAFVGPHAEHMMASLHADHCFLSTVGLDAEFGLSTLDIMEAQLNRRMIESAREVTVLADASKLAHRSLYPIAGFQSIRRVISDTTAPETEVDKLRSLGVEVILT